MLKSFHSDVQDDCYHGYLENLEIKPAQKCLVGLSQNLIGSIERHGDSELPKSFLSHIQDSRLEILQKTSPAKPHLDRAETWWEASE